MKQLPSIFNDVIGPVMRGPSSSHTAASWRVAMMAVQLINGQLKNALIAFDKEGAWVTNYEEQGTVLGMNGGLLQIDMSNDQMKETERIARERNVDIQYEISSFENSHANSMQLTLLDENEDQVQVLAASLGGGSFEIQRIDNFKVQMKGDQHQLLLWGPNQIENELRELSTNKYRFEQVVSEKKSLYIFASSTAFDEEFIRLLHGFDEIIKICVIQPIMPVVSGREKNLPFDTIASLIHFGQENDMSLGALGLLYEEYRSGLSKGVLKSKMQEIIEIIDNSIQKGLAGTTYQDRILPQQSNLVAKAEKKGRILQDSIINTIIENVAAIMESKSALEVIVANPTAGSCGTVGAALKAVSDEVEASMEERIMAYYAAGLVGAYFAMGPGFSAEEHGCQVECGASAGMAAAGIVELFKGNASEGLGAASMAIQNMIGLVCDPIADRVEAPCLGKNTSAAVNALSSATMAISGFAHLIPLDQVLETVQRVSADMPTCVKCTGLGGLAITPAALKLKAQLEKIKSSE
ncbi:L-serine ammonia-lyase, iron-sulfur-dependent, subunit alpha [Lutimonas sp.]|uniref:L-serine ammonia-lyase, iron-sulfur-dependent, subunit alpha n=1 Tax=Lutimonas sp. TaxID=1872403 RepID=UPI003D9AC67E